MIEALTGTHPDRLEEEKRRGITIDLASRSWKRKACGTVSSMCRGTSVCKKHACGGFRD